MPEKYLANTAANHPAESLADISLSKLNEETLRSRNKAKNNPKRAPH